MEKRCRQAVGVPLTQKGRKTMYTTLNKRIRIAFSSAIILSLAASA
jgi:hypothetical protein